MSRRKDVVETYFEGFRRSDHERILGCLTDDVAWDLPGHMHLTFAGDRIRRVESYVVPLA